MPIQNMPSSLQAAIQQGFLAREFQNGLQSAIGYRAIADRELVSIGVGETVTKIRYGFKAPVTSPANPATNTGLDNGMTPTPFTIEQYTLGLGMYYDTIDLNIVTSMVSIANQFLVNANVNGTQARQSIDRIARNVLFNAYLGGQTRVRNTLGAPATTIAVDDIRGFSQVLVNGAFTSVSSANTAQVLVGSSTYNLTGVTTDVTNVSSTIASGGISGTLTFSTSVTVANGTAGNAVTHLNSPAIIRPNGQYYGGNAFSSTTSTASLQATDILTFGTIEDAVMTLRNNTGIMDQMFNLYLDSASMRQLYSDPDFKLMYQGQYGSAELQQGKVFQLMGVNFIPTTEAIVETPANVKIRRPILCAPGALIEGDFAGVEERAADFGGVNSETTIIDSVAMVTRAPLDRLGQIIAQSWFWIGGFVAPSDATATSQIIPTAGKQYLKRAIVIEHAA